MGLRRYGRYLGKRVMRLSASPHAIAAGVASGAAVSMFPLIGLHFFLGFVLAFITRGNMIAAAIGTAWGNPLTFPFFFAASYSVGHWATGGGDASAADGSRLAMTAEQIEGGFFADGFAAAWPTFKAMMIGGLPIAILVYALFYLAVRALVTRFRMMRQTQMAERRGRQQNISG
ncbi:DUF2062 domain-containing protein [Devosia limi]|nr:DUF2062 domain-containing protein [Devosia limi]SHF62923.1 hypothetical protein SAMN02745223_03166 [Devosia limi DSM 17137]